MRIWDIHPGYLNRQSLLGEHRELHGMVSILVHQKKGYSRHPETLRWKKFGWALSQRHQLLAAEMALRGYQDKSPVSLDSNVDAWPEIFIDPPQRQFEILKQKYAGKEPGRIPLPKNAQQLWQQHKYSVMARDILRYQEIGRRVAGMPSSQNYAELSQQLIEILRSRPSTGGIRNSLQHMWGYVSAEYAGEKKNLHKWPLQKLLTEIQKLATATNESYLISSTALAELAVWI